LSVERSKEDRSKKLVASLSALSYYELENEKETGRGDL
jgi:hypothetical protein